MYHHAFRVTVDMVATLMDACSSVLMMYGPINFDTGCPLALTGGFASYIVIYYLMHLNSMFYASVQLSHSYLGLSDVFMYHYFLYIF